jgi:hypothetical protein
MQFSAGIPQDYKSCTVFGALIRSNAAATDRTSIILTPLWSEIQNIEKDIFI